MTPRYLPQDWEPTDAELILKAAARLIPLGVGVVTAGMIWAWRLWGR